MAVFNHKSAFTKFPVYSHQNPDSDDPGRPQKKRGRKRLPESKYLGIIRRDLLVLQTSSKVSSKWLINLRQLF